MVDWQVIRVAETGSTNVDLTAMAHDGAAEGTVLLADHQTAGRGRLGRAWQAPPGTGLAVSVLLRPVEVPASRWPWVPLLMGVCVVDALRSYPGVETALKWPNDVLLGGAKLAGLLIERIETRAGPAAVAGVGLNLTAAPEDSASLAAGGHATAERDGVLDALLASLDHRYRAWRRAGGDPRAGLASAYRGVCETLGLEVRAELPGRAAVEGRAIDVDDLGRLVIRTVSGEEAVGAGDIVHLRRAAQKPHDQPDG
jgi:BirA family transcriptional regulator, biotin operon repressor / biotin---[acetyl-CoA-carboxylase] ligase